MTSPTPCTPTPTPALDRATTSTGAVARTTRRDRSHRTTVAVMLVAVLAGLSGCTPTTNAEPPTASPVATTGPHADAPDGEVEQVAGTDGEPPDLSAATAALSDPSERGADAAVALFLEGWAYGATTGDRTLVDLVSSDSCAFCASVAAGVETTVLSPADGYHLEMTTRQVEPFAPAGESLVAEVVLHVRTTFTQLRDDGTPHLHELQDQAQLLRMELRRDGDRWVIAGVSSTPWDET